MLVNMIKNINNLKEVYYILKKIKRKEYNLLIIFK